MKRSALLTLSIVCSPGAFEGRNGIDENYQAANYRATSSHNLPQLLLSLISQNVRNGEASVH